MLVAHIYQEVTLDLLTCPELKLASTSEETEGDFKTRIALFLREKLDDEIEKMRKRYSTRLTSLQEQVRKAEVRVEKSRDQYGQQKMTTAISFGATLLGALLGRKAVSAGTLGRATTTISTKPSCNGPFGKRYSNPVWSSELVATPFATVLPLTCWKRVTTSEPFRNYWGIRM